MRRLFVSWVVAAAGVVAGRAGGGGCGGSTAGKATAVPPSAGAVVDIKNIAFNPPTVTIKAGQTVVWKFDDGSIAHNVTGEGFRSADRSSGTFSHTFSTRRRLQVPLHHP